jgi:hypothetical protein
MHRAGGCMVDVYVQTYSRHAVHSRTRRRVGTEFAEPERAVLPADQRNTEQSFDCVTVAFEAKNS